MSQNASASGDAGAGAGRSETPGSGLYRNILPAGPGERNSSAQQHKKRKITAVACQSCQKKRCKVSRYSPLPLESACCHSEAPEALQVKIPLWKQPSCSFTSFKHIKSTNSPPSLSPVRRTTPTMQCMRSRPTTRPLRLRNTRQSKSLGCIEGAQSRVGDRDE